MELQTTVLSASKMSEQRIVRIRRYDQKHDCTSLVNVCLNGEVLVHHDTQISGNYGWLGNEAADDERTVVEITTSARGRQPKKFRLSWIQPQPIGLHP